MRLSSKPQLDYGIQQKISTGQYRAMVAAVGLGPHLITSAHLLLFQCYRAILRKYPQAVPRLLRALKPARLEGTSAWEALEKCRSKWHPFYMALEKEPLKKPGGVLKYIRKTAEGLMDGPKETDALFFQDYEAPQRVTDDLFEEQNRMASLIARKGIKDMIRNHPDIKPVRARDLLQLYQARLDGVSRSHESSHSAAAYLGWEQKRVERVWKDLTSKILSLPKNDLL